ncbi:MAG: hypothetical protein JRD94_11955 [Deltaproteobacteria bacterium]|nr:hypothetical protein [Deltaproteobacteria bacterium]
MASSHVAGADARSAFVASEDQALLVFIQNLPDDYITKYIVFDPNKQCVAEVGGREAAVIPMKPGKYTYYLASYNNHRIDVDLQAGRTYFVRLSAVEKVATSRSVVTPVQRGRTNRTQRRINEANADWKNGDKIYRYNYSLLKEDGLTALEVSWLRDR